MRLIEGGCLLAAALLAASGCESLNPRTVQIDAASGRFQSAQLTYQLDTARLGQPAQTARTEGQQVSFQQPPRNPLPDRSYARLSIQYPHPRGRAGYALAEVIIESEHPPEKAGASAEKSGFQKFVSGLTEAMNDILPGMAYGESVREAWALDVAKEDVDQLVGHLANSGYFQYGPAPTPGVDMFTRLDGKIIRKNWRQVPALDAFIERVRQEGKLVSHVPAKSSPSAGVNMAGGPDASAAAYRQPPQGRQAALGPPPQPYPIGNALPSRQFGPPQPGPGPRYSAPAPAQNGWGPAPQQTSPPQQAQSWTPQPYANPAPPAAAGQLPPPAGGQPYPKTAPPQAYPQTSQTVGPHAGGGAYPYRR